jgi:hypothetical protein
MALKRREKNRLLNKRFLNFEIQQFFVGKEPKDEKINPWCGVDRFGSMVIIWKENNNFRY